MIAFRVVEAVVVLLAAAALATVLLLGAPRLGAGRRDGATDLDDREDRLTRAPDGGSDRESPGIS